jgi:C4-dicarboxylate transporter DctQ subunit
MPDDLRARSLQIINLAACLLLAAAVGLMFMQVILRFGFNNPQAWAEEVDRYLFVWSVYFGAVIALVKDTHIRVTVLTDPFGPAGKRWSDILNRWINVISIGFVCYYAWQLAYDNRAMTFYTLPWIPQIIFFLAVPVCMTLMIVYLLVQRQSRTGGA